MVFTCKMQNLSMIIPEAEIMVPDSETNVHTKHIPNPTIPSNRTESGNSVTQNEVYLPNIDEETRDTKENADGKDNLSERGANEIVDVLEEKELEVKGEHEDMISHVKEDKDKKVDVEKELFSEKERRKIDKRKERDKGLFGEEGETGNSKESFDERQKNAIDIKRNEEKHKYDPRAYQESERKESDRAEEIENEEKSDFDIKRDGPVNYEDNKLKIKEGRTDTNRDKENWNGKKAFDKVGYREERVGPESFDNVDIIGDQKGGKIPGEESFDDKKFDDDGNDLIKGKKEGTLTKKENERVAKGEITIYKRDQRENDDKRKAGEGDLENTNDERIEKKRKIDGRRMDENKGNELNSNEESERHREGDNENKIQEEKEEDNEEDEELNANNVNTLVHKKDERINIEEEKEEEEDKKVKKEEETVDNDGSSNEEQENALNVNENKENKEVENKTEEEESLNTYTVSRSKREESRKDNEQRADQEDKREDIKGVEKERLRGERETYYKEIEHIETSLGPDKKNDEVQENRNEKDGRTNENGDELMQQKNGEIKRDKNNREEHRVTKTNIEVEGGKNTKGGTNIKGETKKKAGGPSSASFKDKGKGGKQKNRNTEKSKEQPRVRNAQPPDNSAQQTGSCKDDQPKKVLFVHIYFEFQYLLIYF